MSFKVGDLIRYKKESGLDTSRYMLVTGYGTSYQRQITGTYRVYKLLDVRKDIHYEWSDRWVDAEFVLVQ